MKRDLIIENIKKILKDDLSIFVEDVDTDLLEAGLDSLSTIKFIIKLENSFDFSFEDDDLLKENFRSINVIADFVEKTIK